MTTPYPDKPLANVKAWFYYIKYLIVLYDKRIAR